MKSLSRYRHPHHWLVCLGGVGCSLSAESYPLPKCGALSSPKTYLASREGACLQFRLPWSSALILPHRLIRAITLHGTALHCITLQCVVLHCYACEWTIRTAYTARSSAINRRVTDQTCSSLLDAVPYLFCPALSVLLRVTSHWLEITPTKWTDGLSATFPYPLLPSNEVHHSFAKLCERGSSGI